jgi:hypothetical protein
MRNAWWHTQTEPGGHDSISELVAFALLPVVEELEALYNGGRPFPEIPDRRRPKAGPSGMPGSARPSACGTATVRHGRDVPRQRRRPAGPLRAVASGREPISLAAHAARGRTPAPAVGGPAT